MERARCKGHLPKFSRYPSGTLFLKDGVIYRCIHKTYQPHYDHLMDSGLYQKLVGLGLLIPHQEANIECSVFAETYKVIQPQQIPFISYPY